MARPIRDEPERLNRCAGRMKRPTQGAWAGMGNRELGRVSIMTMSIVRKNKQNAPVGRGRVVYISALVAGLAALTAVGCASNRNPHTNYSVPPQNTQEQKAALSKVTIDPVGTQGQYTRDLYMTDAAGVQLPQVHLTEAWNQTGETEARRAAAQSASVRALADHREGMAFTDVQRQESFTQHEISHAEANRLESVLTAKIAENSVRTEAQRELYDTESARKDELLQAAVKQWQSEVEKIRAQTTSEWNSARAEYDRMLAQRDSVNRRGVANIEQMGVTAQRTQERAAARVEALRSEAQTIRDQSTARIQELQQQIRTVDERTQARVSDLRQQAKSIGQEGRAHAEQLRARAVSVEEQDVNEAFRLGISGAEASFTEAQAESQHLFQQGDALQERLTAEVTRRMSHAVKQFEIDKTDYEQAISAIESFIEQGKADVSRTRVEAERIEKSARAAFIKAETEARTNAIRETSRQQFKLAEEQAKQIRAEAEAEAARVLAEYSALLAKQRAKGEVTIPGKTAEQVPGATSKDQNPEFAKAPKAGERLDPKHVAAFKAALAQSVSLRTQADAQEQELFAVAEQRSQAFSSWWAQRQATHEASIADAQAFERQTKAEISNFEARAESLLKNATAELGRAKLEAEAGRREMLAEITNLRAEAEAIDKKTEARVTQLTAQADATERNGQSELRSLRVVLDSTRERADAMHAKFLAEADSLEKSQRAVVAQMNEQIRTERQVLEAELAKLDQSADSYLRVAEATFNENVAYVAMLQKVNTATYDELLAANESERRINEADIAYRRDANLANQLVAQAEVQRAVANADARLGFAESRDAVARAQIITNTAIAQAAVDEQFAIASAQDKTTRSLFDARIASTIADRDRSYAMAYLDSQQSRVRQEQAVAAAAAYHELSNQAFTLLNERNRAFQTAAQENWSSELAQPTPLPQPLNTTALYNGSEQFLNGQSNEGVTFVNVPIDDEN